MVTHVPIHYQIKLSYGGHRNTYKMLRKAIENYQINRVYAYTLHRSQQLYIKTFLMSMPMPTSCISS